MAKAKKKIKEKPTKINLTFEEAMKKALTTPLKKTSTKLNDKRKPNKSL
jgi:hypothetical protein